MAEVATTNQASAAAESHDHDHCQCGGHDHSHSHECVTCGTGHDRSMGRFSVAMIGGLFILNSFILQWALPNQRMAAELSAALGAIILAYPIIMTAIKDLMIGKVYMNELVALALLAAFAGKDRQSAGIIAFFLLITIIIESRTASGAQRSIEGLVKLTPNDARKLVDGREVNVSALELVVGDIIRVRPGENFPVDGRIKVGDSTVNQASITGESLPVDKFPDDDVYAGTQNLTGAIDVEVTKVGEDTTLGKVKDMLLQAEGSKTPIIRIIDRYAGYYTPGNPDAGCIDLVVHQRFATGDYPDGYRLSLCDRSGDSDSGCCGGSGGGASGDFYKKCFPFGTSFQDPDICFDKTGTLTDGILSVVSLKPIDGIAPAELLKMTAAAETHSNHPTAIALQKLAEEAGLTLPEAANFTETHGKGVEAMVEGQKVQVGRPAWLESLGVHVDHPENQEDHGMSVVYAACEGKVMGWVGFKDKTRKEAFEIVADLKTLGIKHCAMVTGDRGSVAEGVATQLKLEEYRSECLPETKVEYVENMKKSSLVAVVGDGVNDAPALAAGDLGIAMGAIGSDIAVNSASIALMTNDLRRIPMLVYLSRKSRIIINQNLFMGMLFVFGGMILSVFGMMTPIWAAVLHSFSTILIIFNSARLVRTGEELTLEEQRQSQTEA